jgi:hypothetical protein
MVQSVRLSEAEQEKIRNKAIDINKLLVKKGHQPLRDSELVHKILELSMTCLTIMPDGELGFESI